MLEWQKFAAVFQAKPDYSLDHRQVDAINRHRKELGGTLFFDRVWDSVGLKQASKAYPPKTNTDLKALWQKIVDSAAPEYQKHALLFYVLKDCRSLTNADINFASKVYLPRRYEIVMTGLWELDHCQFSRALEHLTDPSVSPTFPDEILLILIRHPKCDNHLAMAYFNTVCPPLLNTQALDACFDLLCKTSVVEAYRYSQSQPEAKHKTLLETLVMIVHSETANAARAERAVTLLALPYTDEEEIWFEEYLLNGPGATLPGATDSVTIRRIAIGKELRTFDRRSGPKINGLNWDDIRSSMQRTAVG